MRIFLELNGMTIKKFHCYKIDAAIERKIKKISKDCIFFFCHLYSINRYNLFSEFYNSTNKFNGII